MQPRKDDITVFDLLPAIDLRGGRVVRLLRGDFARETVFGEDPLVVARRFVDGGARWLHVVDLDGARNPAARQSEVVASIIAGVGKRANVEVAGGLRDEASVAAALAAGAARAVLGTAALQEPAFVASLVAAHGADRIAVALDVRDGLAVGHGWRADASGTPVLDALAVLADAGAATFEVTAIDRDGTLEGPDLALLGRLVRAGRGSIVASAGISSADDVRAVRSIGCVGAIVGRALYDGTFALDAAISASRTPPTGDVPGG